MDVVTLLGGDLSDIVDVVQDIMLHLADRLGQCTYLVTVFHLIQDIGYTA